jgi:hypothetical protein
VADDGRVVGYIPSTEAMAGVSGVVRYRAEFSDVE